MCPLRYDFPCSTSLAKVRCYRGTTRSASLKSAHGLYQAVPDFVDSLGTCVAAAHAVRLVNSFQRQKSDTIGDDR